MLQLLIINNMRQCLIEDYFEGEPFKRFS